MITATMKVLAVFVVIFGVHQVVARPHDREKRVSDSHLSNLETISTLNKYKRRLAQTTPIDLNSISSYNIGRKRRSNQALMNSVLEQLDEYATEEPAPASFEGNDSQEYPYPFLEYFRIAQGEDQED